MKALTIFLRVAGLLLVLAIGAVVLLTTLVDLNDYKPEIAALVKENTGRTLSLHGDIEFAFFPWLGIKIARVALSNREGFGQTPMLAVEEAAIKIKLLPLLITRVEVDTVRLHKPHIYLARKADGTTNWGDLTAKAWQGGGASDSKKSPPDAALLAGLAVQGISIQDGWVDWDDRVAGQSITLQALNLEIGTLQPGEPLDITASVEAESNMFPESVAITAVTTAQLAENFESISLRDTGIGIDTPTIAANFSIEMMSYAVRSKLAVLNELQGNATHGEINTKLEIPNITFNESEESLQIPAIEIEQDDAFLSMSLNSVGVLSDCAEMTANGSVDAGAKDVGELLERNNLKPYVPLRRLGTALISLAGPVTVKFQFDLANSELKLIKLVAKFSNELLTWSKEYKEITIPLNL